MNALVAFASFVVFVLLILVATRLGAKYLFVLSTTFIVISNITVQIPVTIFGVTISWAIIIYSMVYLITDVLSESFAKHLAYKLAACNLSVQIILWLYVWSSLKVEPVGPAGTAAFENATELFTATARITLAAIVAAAGAFIDIAIYETIKRRFGGPLWIRNNVSTIVGQGANTILFFVIALYGVVEANVLFQIVWTAILAKMAIAACDTPFIYLARRLREERRPWAGNHLRGTSGPSNEEADEAG